MSGIKRTPEDIRFSQMVRARDNWTCQRCGAVHVPNSRGLHCAHCFTRRTRREGLRFDPDNALALCYGCHQFVDSHAAEKEALWRLRIGHDRYDRIAAIAHEKRETA